MFDKLQDFLPKAWKEVIFYANYTSGSYSMKFYTNAGNNKYIDCFSLPEINRVQLIKAFMNIDKELSSERNSLSDNDKWNTFTMIVDSQGHMKTDFDYVSTEESTIEYEREWEKKYLRKDGLK